MRINNKRVIPYVEVFYYLLIIGILSAILLLFIPVGLIVRRIPAYAILLIFFLIFFLFTKIGHQHFEYSSDGEVLNIKTENKFLSKIFPKYKKFNDFPKGKLIGFKIKRRLLLRDLELYVTSKRTANGMTKLKYNITYLDKREISDLKKSLNKIVSNNKQKEEEIDKE